MEEKKIVCSRRVKVKDNDQQYNYVTKKVETDKIKIFIQKGKATIDDEEIIDVAFVHYRDEKGRPVQLDLRENSEINKIIRQKIFSEFGQIKIKAEGNLTNFAGLPCIELIVTRDASCFERNRFRSFDPNRCNLWKFDIEQKKKPKIRRLTPDEFDVSNAVSSVVEEKMNEALFAKLAESCPELAEIPITLATTGKKKKK